MEIHIRRVFILSRHVFINLTLRLQQPYLRKHKDKSQLGSIQDAPGQDCKPYQDTRHSYISVLTTSWQQN
jgi:hypothetical protein